MKKNWYKMMTKTVIKWIYNIGCLLIGVILFLFVYPSLWDLLNKLLFIFSEELMVGVYILILIFLILGYVGVVSAINELLFSTKCRKGS